MRCAISLGLAGHTFHFHCGSGWHVTRHTILFPEVDAGEISIFLRGMAGSVVSLTLCDSECGDFVLDSYDEDKRNIMLRCPSTKETRQ
jgi:hypothetical protein